MYLLRSPRKGAVVKKIATVIGARPQFIKAAMVSKAFVASRRINESIIHTGQHYDPNMSDVFFEEMGIPKPKHHLNIGSGSHGLQTGRMLEAIEKVLLEDRPDGLLVYGDTNSTLAGALAAVKIHVPVIHVEAGLRSFNKGMPEEINRICTDHVSDLLFAPTESAVKNLKNEGITSSKVVRSGDVMFDAVQHYGTLAKRQSRILESLGLIAKTFILATIHRADNTDRSETIQILFAAFAKLSRKFPVVLPLHPRTRAIAVKLGLTDGLPASFKIIEPTGYLDMLLLEREAAVVATDSGGVQKEAFFAGTPCVTLRTETEWVELIASGWNRLCSVASEDDIVNTVTSAIGTQGRPCTEYGDGKSSELIAERVLSLAAGSH